MTPPRWLFFPTQSTAAQYIYEVQTDRTIARGSPSTTQRKQDSTGTESGSLADQFSPFVNNNHVYTAASISISGTNARPAFNLTVSDGSAGTFWSDNNLDDTDNITITVTLTF